MHGSTLPLSSAEGDTSRTGRTVTLLSVAAFAMTTTEFIIVGLLPALAKEFSVSTALTGQLVTLFAFTVMISGPPLTALLSHHNRKRLFLVLMLVLMATNILAAMAPTLWVLAVARFIPGMVIPIFWGTASETAAELVGAKKAGKAVAHVYMGIAAGMVLGIPLGTLAATVVGWRGTFWGLAGLSLTIFGLLACIMPSVAGNERVHLSHQLKILHQPVFLAHLLLSVIVFTAMFTAYTYLADTLEKIAHVPSSQIGWWLMGFGVVGLAGNSLAGHFVGRNPVRPTIIATLALAISAVAADMLAHNLWAMAIALALWGMANTALFAISQVRVMNAATHAQALAGTLNVSMANGGIGLGAIVGGFVIEHFGIQYLGLATGTIALLAIVLAIWIGRAMGKEAV